ncbi:UDP-glucose 4-epimerase GalE [Parvibaculum sp.]|uniref:UDP-glucose 4-epimerase GalE n=1 Tax=Parvibaculum sp. TaxID=2024848 RepID=UPI0034A03AB4
MTVVFVTGGAGYIGSHTAKALHRAGFTPVVIDNLSRGHEWAVKWGPLEKIDLADGAALDAAFARHRPAAVLHFAAFAYVGESVSNPYLYYRNNVGGTLSLLEAMRRADCGKIVFSSTCATYGIPDKTPISEDAPQRPVNPYGASKLMVERILADAGAAHDLRSVCLRYFNAAGADPDGDIGEAHDPETHLVPLALQAAAGANTALSIFGDDYATPDGSCIRDYIHVSDLADAHVLALRWLLDGNPSRQFNLGNGRGYSVREVVEAVRRISGRAVPVEVGPRRAGDPPVLVADARRAADELGWKPQRVDLDAQIADAWNWFAKMQRGRG